MSLRIGLFIIVMAWFSRLMGQSVPDEGPTLADIVKMEMNRFNRGQMKSDASTVGAEYDWKFAVCNWQIDPWVRNIEGRVVNYIDVLNPVDSVSFDFNQNLDISAIRWQGTNLNFDFASPYILVVYFPNEVSGEQIIEVEYAGDPTNIETRSFNQFIRTVNGQNYAEIYTLSQPFGARDWWPCKQRLSDKLDSVRIHITIPTGNKAGSNGKLLNIDTSQPGWETYEWFHKYPIPAYLVSVAISNYQEFIQMVELETETVEILNYVYPERLETELDRAEAIPAMM